jgi:thioredoxin-related protein
MLESIKNRSEMITNVGLVVLIGLTLFFAVSIFNKRGDDAAKDEPTQPPSPNKIVIPGGKVKLEGVDFAANGRTLALVVQKSCGYCTASMPFYQKLIPHAKEAGVPVIVLAPDTVDESKQYFAKNGVEGDLGFHRASMSSVNARGTPTIILYNNEGAELRRWVGKLQSAAAEKDVLDQL